MCRWGCCRLSLGERGVEFQAKPEVFSHYCSEKASGFSFSLLSYPKTFLSHWCFTVKRMFQRSTVEPPKLEHRLRHRQVCFYCMSVQFIYITEWTLSAASCLHTHTRVFFSPLCERRKFLHDNMVEVPNRILFSEMKHVTVSIPLDTCGCRPRPPTSAKRLFSFVLVCQKNNWKFWMDFDENFWSRWGQLEEQSMTFRWWSGSRSASRIL